MNTGNSSFTRWIGFFVVAFFLFATANGRADSLAPTSLHCDDLANPAGVDFQQPALSWVLNPGERGRAQSAYEILVASSTDILGTDMADLWDSGEVKSSQSIQVRYAGKPLVSSGRYFWKVRIRDEQGNVSGWSEPASWTMGLLDPGDWQAKWIGLDQPTQTNGRSPDGTLACWRSRRPTTKLRHGSRSSCRAVRSLM